MYESTINISIDKNGSQEPLNFVHTLNETLTVTGTISGTVELNTVWVNNTIEGNVLSIVEVGSETQELTEAWVSSLQEKAILNGITIYISVSQEQ